MWMPHYAIYKIVPIMKPQKNSISQMVQTKVSLWEHY